MPRDYYEILGVEPGGHRGGDQEGVPRGWRATFTPTSTGTTRRRRRSSSRPPRHTRCSPTPSAGAPTTPSATRGCAPAASPRTPPAASRTSSPRCSAAATRSFGDLFGFGRQPVRRRAATSAVEVEITLGEVLTGAEREVTFEAVSVCEHCHGNGAEPGTPIRHLRDLRRHRAGAAGPPHRLRPARADGHLPDLSRRRADRRAALRALRRRGPRAPGAHLGRRDPGGDRVRAADQDRGRRPRGRARCAGGRPLRARLGRRGRALRAPRRRPDHRREGPGDAGDGRRRALGADARRRPRGRGSRRRPARRHRSRSRGSACRRCAGRRRGDSTWSSTSSSRGSSPASSASSPGSCTSRSTAPPAGDPARGPLPPRARRAGARRAAELAPGGVEEDDGDDWVEYAIYGPPGEVPACPTSRRRPATGWSRSRSTEIPDDWADRWRDFHRPVSIAGGRIVVRPSWEAGRGFGRPRWTSVVDPGQAFGTGAHATTRLCLELLLELADARRGGGPARRPRHRLGGARDRGREARLGAGDRLRQRAGGARGGGRRTRPPTGSSSSSSASTCASSAAPAAPTVVANLTAPLLLDGRRPAPIEPPRSLVCSGLLRRRGRPGRGGARRRRARGRRAAGRGDWAALLGRSVSSDGGAG